MSAGSTKFTVSRIAALSLVSLWLAGCTNTNNPPAPVSSAGGAASSSTNSGMLITPPPSGVKSAPQAQPIQPMQTQTIQPQPAPVAQEPVQTVNGRIVYNRKYGDIPKGSYTGGSTYTVKRGDTLFYIAWVTGNDFRDLAQRNNIPAPYALNVGRYCRSVTPQASRSPAKTPFLRPAQERAAVRRPAQLLHKNRPRWLLHNRLLRILNLQVNRVLPRCCLIINQRLQPQRLSRR